MAKWFVNGAGVGNTGRIRCETVDVDGAAVDATAVAVRIINKETGAQVLASTNILANKSSTGVYYLDWAPTAAGRYVAIGTSTVQGVSEVAVIGFVVYDPTDAPLVAT